jgi:hypothetical protein
MRPLTAASLTAMWLVSVWLIASGDPIRESILGVALREDVSFAVGFSEPAFRSVEPGMSDQSVRGLLGPPHNESWYYPPRDQPALRAADASVAGIRAECLGVRFEWGFTVNTFDEDSCGKLGSGSASRSTMPGESSDLRAKRAGSIPGVLPAPFTAGGRSAS